VLLRGIFILISVLGLSAALATVLARNLVRAAIALVGFFFCVACLFLLLEAEFLAAVQILVYIGAVSVLILFGIMLTRNVQGDETTRSRLPTRVIAGLGAFGLLVMLFLAIRGDTGRSDRPAWSSITSRPDSQPTSTQAPAADPRALNDMTRTIGVELLTRYVIAFELAGLLLTAAVVGAVALAMNEAEDEAGPRAVATGAALLEGDSGPVSPELPPGSAPPAEVVAEPAVN
jgi:NADH-quinone oxidoreductase subunit J